ncbi:MAG TPA: hypothetical protein EYN38_03485 [Flavobacteriales bacterium]|nr:hypothetical protein [Flavobacteriales bacterium]HIA12181.1 hypothetical protein [Flavobacteriales bacterium]HIO72148.1 hypothetical protein [Flavobacteriales bacterium]
MKKALFFAIVVMAVSFASCKKDRTCTCTSTYTPSGGSSYTSSSTKQYTKVKKSDVAYDCVSYTETDEDGDMITVDCTLN